MLKDFNVGVVLAVKDLAKAKEFYGAKLGFEEDPKQDEGGVLYKSGQSKFFIYPSEFAGTNKATAAAWNVNDVNAVVSDLKSRGVSFEHYDMPGVKLEGDVHVMEQYGVKSAWFKDPDGNILNILSM